MHDQLRRFIYTLAAFAAALLIYTLVRENGFGLSESQRGAEKFTTPASPKLSESEIPGLARLDEEYTKLAAAVLPSVVSVTTTSVVQRYQAFGPFIIDGGQEAQKGIGSGAIISKEGHIITNYHVIEGAQMVQVTTQDNKTYKARVLNGSKTRDIAMLKIESSRKDFPALTFADSDKVRVGQVVFAVGNPFGLSGTVTQGIISARDRHISDNANDPNDYLQTDTVINPGNSGGPLVNIRGEILGINVAIYRGDQNVRAWQGVGLAVPGNQAKQVVESVLALASGRKPVVQSSGYLGLHVGEDILPVQSGNQIVAGVMVQFVYDGSPAQQAEIRAGDVIVAYNNKPFDSAAQLLAMIHETKPGTTVKLQILRGGNFYSVDTTIGTQPQ